MSVNTKKIPIRKCLGCNEAKEKKDLIRVVRTPDGNLVIDKTGKLSGRGAYLCNNIECFKKLKKSRRLEKSLDINMSDEMYEELSKMILGV